MGPAQIAAIWVFGFEYAAKVGQVLSTHIFSFLYSYWFWVAKIWICYWRCSKIPKEPDLKFYK